MFKNRKRRATERAARVKVSQTEECEEWGFHAIDRDRPWIFKIEKTMRYGTNVKGWVFDSRWLSLAIDGMVTIYASSENPYAWDGCSPKFVLSKKLLTVGTPDGYKDIHMELPITANASLVHDAFYQYLHVIPVPRREVDNIFKNILRRDGFILWPLYYVAVRIFGGWFVSQEGVNGVYEDKYRPVFLANSNS